MRVLPTTDASAASASDPSGLEAQLLGQLQQDRWQQGLNGLVSTGSLAGLARDAPQRSCGVVLHGRAADMVERNYFSHEIPPCGTDVAAAISATGLPTQAWGENIAWESGTSPAAVNAGFMASPGHRANILGNFNSVGVGAWPAPGPWSGGGAPHTGVVVFVVLFARVPGVVGPPPPGAPQPQPPPPVAAAAPAPPPPVAQPAPPASTDPTAQAVDAGAGDVILPRLSRPPPLTVAIRHAARPPPFPAPLTLALVIGPPVLAVMALGGRRRLRRL